MASAGTVTVDFSAETAKFTSQLRKVDQSIESLGGRFDAVGKLARNAFAAVSFAAITSQITQLVTASLELGGAISDATKKAGISAESFSELNFAAKLAGVSTEDLSSAFAKFQQEISRGGEKIRSLGVNLEQLRALQPDRQFEVIAEAIASIENPTTRAGAAIEVFGRSGANLLPLFEEGAKGIRSAREEAQRLGITLSTDQANALDAAGDAVDKLKSRTELLALTFTAALAPSIDVVTRKLQELLSPTSESQKELETLTDQFETELKRRRNLIDEVTQLQQRKQSTFVPGLDAEFDKAITEAQQKIRVTENLLNSLNGKILQFNIEAEQAKQKAEAPVPDGIVNPGARTFGTDAEKKAKELATLNQQLNDEFLRNSSELDKIVEGLRQGQEEAFFASEKRKTDIVAEETRRQADLEQRLADFRAQKSVEDEQRQFELSQAKFDIAEGGFALVSALASKDAKLQKKIAIAQATINTIRGVTFQLTNGDVYSAIPRAIAVGLFGAAQIAKIISTPEIGGGGGVSIGGGAGVSIATQPTSPFNQQPSQQPQALTQPTATQIIFNGLITPESRDAIVDIIKKATDDDVIVINQRSAQAQMFMTAQ